jgi:hypothetical protein
MILLSSGDGVVGSKKCLAGEEVLKPSPLLLPNSTQQAPHRSHMQPRVHLQDGETHRQDWPGTETDVENIKNGAEQGEREPAAAVEAKEEGAISSTRVKSLLG